MRGAEKIEIVSISEIKPYERNARTHDADQVKRIAASITEFGFTNPILIDGDGVIIAGHGRLAAAQLLGLDLVPVVRLPYLDDKQRRALVLADNRLAMDAGWNADILRGELESLRLEGLDLDVTGFNLNEINLLLPKNEKQKTENRETKNDEVVDDEKPERDYSNNNQEIDMDHLVKDGVTCPRCKFTFEAKHGT